MTKYGECAKHLNNSMIDCTECAMENNKTDLSKLNFEFKVFCECQKASCKHCKGNIEPFNFDIEAKSFDYIEPDFDEMWKNIRDRLDNPLVYFIEHKETKEWIHRTEKRTTKEPLCAMKFEGKDGKAMANLFLFLNQDVGTLKDFVVTEHLFED